MARLPSTATCTGALWCFEQTGKYVLVSCFTITGDSKQRVGEKTKPTINNRLRFAMSGTRLSTYGPTPTLERSLAIAKSQFAELKLQLDEILNVRLPAMEKALREAGAPWVEGQPIPE